MRSPLFAKRPMREMYCRGVSSSLNCWRKEAICSSSALVFKWYSNKVFSVKESLDMYIFVGYNIYWYYIQGKEEKGNEGEFGIGQSKKERKKRKNTWRNTVLLGHFAVEVKEIEKTSSTLYWQNNGTIVSITNPVQKIERKGRGKKKEYQVLPDHEPLQQSIECYIIRNISVSFHLFDKFVYHFGIFYKTRPFN